VLPTLSEGLEIELSEFTAENAMRKGDYVRQVVEIVIGDVPTVVRIRLMRLFMSLSGILLQGSIFTNLFDTLSHQVYLWKVQVGIYLLGKIYPGAHIIPPGVYFAPLLGRRPSFSIAFLVYHSYLHELCSHGVFLDVRRFADSPE